MGYGASYYSYLYARCAAAQAWTGLLRSGGSGGKGDGGGALDRGAWGVVWREILRPGGAADATAVLQGALGPGAVVTAPGGGRTPSPAALLAEVNAARGV